MPDPADLRRRAARGHGLHIPLGETVTTAAATEVARALQVALGPDMAVFASPRGGGPILTVLQLLSDAEAAALRPALERLVAEFRRHAKALVALLDNDPAESVRYRDATWLLYPHEPHCQFENAASGEVVEAHVYDPGLVDPYFLLLYGETSGRHGAVVEACVHGFHDMVRLLATIGIGRNG